jgi:hypothetical protein
VATPQVIPARQTRLLGAWQRANHRIDLPGLGVTGILGADPPGLAPQVMRGR